VRSISKRNGMQHECGSNQLQNTNLEVSSILKFD